MLLSFSSPLTLPFLPSPPPPTILCPAVRFHIFLFIFRQFGTVFKALHLPSKKEYAVKIIELTEHEGDRKMIEKEVEIVSKCSSPFIVKHFGCLFKLPCIWVREKKQKNTTKTSNERQWAGTVISIVICLVIYFSFS